MQQEFNIKNENIYNMDETGTVLGTVNSTRVIVNKSIASNFQKEPG